MAYNLTKRSATDDIDPDTVELAPREVALLSFLSIRRRQPQFASELDERLKLQTGPDSWRTEACLAHLANLGLLDAVEDPPGAYGLPQLG